jgi:tetratricopeptide (TPR) repeat protein
MPALIDPAALAENLASLGSSHKEAWHYEDAIAAFSAAAHFFELAENLESANLCWRKAARYLANLQQHKEAADRFISLAEHQDPESANESRFYAILCILAGNFDVEEAVNVSQQMIGPKAEFVVKLMQSIDARDVEAFTSLVCELDEELPLGRLETGLLYLIKMALKEKIVMN